MKGGRANENNSNIGAGEVGSKLQFPTNFEG